MDVSLREADEEAGEVEEGGPGCDAGGGSEMRLRERRGLCLMDRLHASTRLAWATSRTRALSAAGSSSTVIRGWDSMAPKQ
jgi:hypothetical protein